MTVPTATRAEETTEPTGIGDGIAAGLLRYQLDLIFEGSSRVIDGVSEEELKPDLCHAPACDRAEAAGLLVRLFEGEGAVAIIFENLLPRIRRLGSVPEAQRVGDVVERLDKLLGSYRG
jgi:hypothetical protein